MASRPTIPPVVTVMGRRGKGGKAGPDLIASLVTLHDEDGVQIAAFVRAPEHSKAVKIDASDTQIYDVAAYLHSRIVYASGAWQRPPRRDLGGRCEGR